MQRIQLTPDGAGDYTPGSAQNLYAQLEGTRDTYLIRARECSKYTLPSLIPPSGHSAHTNLPTPYQGIGARGVNNLASKLLLALLPPNSPFFRLTVDPFKVRAQAPDPRMAEEIDTALGEVERAVMREVEQSADRVAVFEALKHLLVGGNALLFMPKEGQMRVFHLDRYVVRRDPMGNVLHVITKESVDPNTLPEPLKALISTDAEAYEAAPKVTEKTCDLYTHLYRKDDKFHIYQEIKGKRVPGSEGTYALDNSPFIPLRYTRIDGEDYGRGYVEEYLGDVKSLEGLTKALVEGSAAAAKVLFLVSPNGTTRMQTLAESPNGAIREGNKEDVSVVQVEKFADFRTAYDMIGRLEERLGYAFLLNTSIQRQAERVTAEEIRYMASELEDALGGLYSILSQEFQLPYVRRKMSQMEQAKRLPKLPKELVKPTIITGLEALGRGHDLNKLDLFIQGLTNTIGPEIVSQYLDISTYISRRATALGIDTQGLVRTPEEIEAAQQQAQQQAMLSQFGPEVLKQAGGLMQKSMDQPNAPQAQSP